MHDRRDFLLCGAAAVALMHTTGCAASSGQKYQEAEADLRRRIAADPTVLDFIRFATLAPSGHNTQPWLFTPQDFGVYIRPDLSRRTRVVDPDDHHLFVSLGCAAENFLIAAAANGRPGVVGFSNDPAECIRIDLTHGLPFSDALYPAIRESQSTRSEYDGRTISNAALKLLEDSARVDGVSVIFVTESSKREVVLESVIQGNNAQMDDMTFIDELRDWIRFNPAQALTTADGLFTRCSGQPTIPTWIGKRTFSHFFKKEAEDTKYARQIRSSSFVAVLIGDKADKDHWVRVGRSFQRLALHATALGIRHALINQPVEVPSVRAEFARWLGIGEARPDLVVRFGYGEPMPMSMRRAVGDVIAA